MAWRKRFQNASEEERAKMLAERKAQREREEKAREKKIYDELKKLFMERCDIQVAIYLALDAGLKVTLETLESFDGKVANAKIANKINERIKGYLKDTKLNVFSTLTFETDYPTKKYMGVIKLRTQHYFGRIFDDELEVKFSLSSDQRVSWSETKRYREENGLDGILDKRIEERKAAKKCYVRDYKRAIKMKEIIEQYKKETNLYVRDFIQEHGIISGYPIRI